MPRSLAPPLFSNHSVEIALRTVVEHSTRPRRPRIAIQAVGLQEIRRAPDARPRTNFRNWKRALAKGGHIGAAVRAEGVGGSDGEGYWA